MIYRKTKGVKCVPFILHLKRGLFSPGVPYSGERVTRAEPGGINGAGGRDERVFT